jgi:hypothetical protein
MILSLHLIKNLQCSDYHRSIQPALYSCWTLIFNWYKLMKVLVLVILRKQPSLLPLLCFHRTLPTSTSVGLDIKSVEPVVMASSITFKQVAACRGVDSDLLTA